MGIFNRSLLRISLGFLTIFLVVAYSNCGAPVAFTPSAEQSSMSSKVTLKSCDALSQPETYQSVMCPSGLGNIIQTQTVTCNGVSGTWISSGWGAPDFGNCGCVHEGEMVNTKTGECQCPAGQSVVGGKCEVPTCDPSSKSDVQTAACPASSVGIITQSRVASCPQGSTVWQYGAWSEWNYNGCSCAVSGQSFDLVTKSCQCGVGYEFYGGACVSVCGSGQYRDSKGVCVNYPCTSYVEVTSPAIIPERSSAGVCYYMKLFNAIPSAPSSGSRMANVLSRNHDSGSTTAPSNPYILGTKTLHITLQGVRGVKLSGAVNTTSPILVDNYILLDLPTGARVYGTADASIIGGNTILFNTTPVVVNSDGFLGGTATVAPLDITPGFSLYKGVDFGIHALDCGGSKRLSDVYLLFQ